MTSNDRQEPSSFDSIKEERDYWKENYFVLETKYQALLSCHSCIDKEEHAQQPLQKRARIESVEFDLSLDPLKLLPEPCTRSIMSYLSGKELLNIMEVSKYWKEFVESRKVLMNRALENIIVKPTIKDYSLPLIERLFDEKTHHRNYKHMKGPNILNEKFVISKVVNPIETYAASLETLNITEINGDYEVKPCAFPKLKKLVVNSSKNRQVYSELLYCLNKFSLPALTHLSLTFYFKDKNSSYDLQKCLNQIPTIETLVIFGGLADDSLENTLHADLHPKLKHLSMNYVVFTNFLQYYQDTLVKFEIDDLTFLELQWILEHLKSLKSLSIGVVYGQENEFENIRNETIEILKIGCCIPETEGVFPTEQDLQQFHRLFLALPSLREITLGGELLEDMLEHLNVEIFQFLASNMFNLKRLTCKALNEEIALASQFAYAEVRNSPDRFINTTFELIVDRTLSSFNEIEREFDFC